MRDSLAAWQLRVPQLRASWDDARPDVPRSRSPTSPSLRMRGAQRGPSAKLPAAGHAVVHDRLRPRHDHHVPADAALRPGARARRARGARRAPGDERTTRRSTPSRARSSTSCAAARRRDNWFARYYGTVDATPLYLILLSEIVALDRRRGARRASSRARACARSSGSTSYGDRDGDGFVEYERRTPTRPREPVVEGLVGLAALLTTARSPSAPIAPCEVQGYVYDAKLRMAELAREVWRDRDARRAARARGGRAARALRRGVLGEERGGYYALALDGDKRPVDSLCSNIGHLLWSGIVPPHRVDAIVDALMGDELWSGWGVRTMSSGDVGLQPALLPQRHGLAPRQFPDRRGARAGRALAGGAAHRAARSSTSAGTSTTSCPRSSPASAATRRRSRSPTRRRRGRRRGRRARRCCCCRCCSASSPTGARQALVSRVQGELPSWAGSLRLAGRAGVRPTLDGASSTTARVRVEET